MRRIIILLALALVAAACAKPAATDPNQVSQLVQKAVEATLTAQPTQPPVPPASAAPSTVVPPTATALPATATSLPTVAPSSTPTPSPTATPVPTKAATTAPTATPTSGPSAIANSAVNLRAGPGTNYPVVGATKQGQTYAVQGRTADGTWLEVCCINQHTVWVAASVVATSGDFAQVAVSQNIPPPPTAAPIPASQIPAGWVEYADPAGRFVIWHPANWTASPGQGEYTDLAINAEKDQPGNHWMFFKAENTPLDKPSVTTWTDVVLDTRISLGGVLLPYDATRSISAGIMVLKYDIDPAVLQVFILVLKTLKAK